MKANEENKTKAVALKYNDDMSAPKVVATGQGTLADTIIATAKSFGVPVQEDPVLVDALRQLEIGQDIPPDLYQVVAEILVFIMDMDKKSVK